MIRRILAVFALAALSGCITTEQAIDAGKTIVTERIAQVNRPVPMFAIGVTNNYAIDEGRWITGRVQAVTADYRYYTPVGPGPVVVNPSPAPMPPPPPAPAPAPTPVYGVPFLGPITGSLVQ
jgi:hypothetical protein